MKNLILSTLLILAATSLIGVAADEPAQPAPDGFAITGDADQGADLYKIHCAKCHGKAGKGNGLMSADLDPKPQDLTNKDLMSAISDWEFFVSVRDGSKAVGLSDQMPAAADILSEQEIQDVAAFARSLAESEDDW